MYEFLPVIADKNAGKFQNHEFLPQIFSLFDKYKHVLADDYYSGNNVEYIFQIIELVNRAYPHFYVILKDSVQHNASGLACNDSFDDKSNRSRDHFGRKTNDLMPGLMPPDDTLFMGFVYLDDWRGNKDRYHSCTITTCIDKRFRGKDALKAGKIFLESIFKNYRLYKVKAEVFEHNHAVKNFLHRLGFVREAVLRQETLRGGKPVNVIVYSKFRDLC